MSQQGIIRAAVLYNITAQQYLLIDPQTAIGDPSNVTWSLIANPNNATRWVNTLELQYFLTDTPIGNPSIISYPWEIKWMYFAN
jgi:hypothetical protein